MAVKDNLIIEESLLKLARFENLTDGQSRIVGRWLRRIGEKRPLTELVNDDEWLWRSLRSLGASSSPGAWQKLEGRLSKQEEPLTVIRLDRRRVIAATFAASLIGTVVFMTVAHRPVTMDKAKVVPVASLTSPIPETPLLTDAAQFIGVDGRKVLIDQQPEGSIIATEGNVNLTKTGKNILSYKAIPGKQAADITHVLSAGNLHGYKLNFLDSSYVYLDKNSAIRYSPGLRGSMQEPNMTGIAWFGIVKKCGAPLSIQANRIKVEVLGTIFRIRAQSGDSVTRVDVYQGAVMVRKDGLKGIKLNDSDAVVFQGDRIEPIRIKDFKGLFVGTDMWKDTDPWFHFENCQLTDAAQQIADYYHTTVQNPLHIPGIPLNGDLPKTLPLPVLLNKVDTLENQKALLTWNGNAIVISAYPH